MTLTIHILLHVAIQQWLPNVWMRSELLRPSLKRRLSQALRGTIMYMEPYMCGSQTRTCIFACNIKTQDHEWDGVSCEAATLNLSKEDRLPTGDPRSR